MKRIIIFTLLVFLNKSIFAQIELPQFFSDSMILQQNTNAAIWGTDKPFTSIEISTSWCKKTTATADSAGKWKTFLQTTSAGGPYSIKINGSTAKELKGILLGEVWFCAGQSNMEMPMKGYTNKEPYQLIDSSDYFVANSFNQSLRVFKPNWNPPSRVPLSDVNGGKWVSARPSTTPDFSAKAYFFARKLQETLKIPVGIIISARGGSSIESWLDSSTLAEVKPVVIPDTLKWQKAHITPTMMFNSFLSPYIGYTIKGIIWSQGESNIVNHAQYLKLFTKLITSWRNKWGLGELPFYFAQLAPYESEKDWDDNKYNFLREAQLNTMLTVPSTGMVVTLDIGTNVTLHYPKKKVVGDRLAAWTLVKTYNKKGMYSGPVFKNLAINQDTLVLKFDYVGLGLTSFDKPLSSFEIAGADNKFYPAIAKINTDNSISVFSDVVKNPLHVKYAFTNYVEASLFNKDGLPASSFRTENMLKTLQQKIK